jgi:hypothetical protein
MEALPLASVAAYSGAALLAAGIVWTVCDRLETLASKESRKSLSKLLTQASTLQIIRAWPQIVIQMFDKVFGARHLTWQCFLRSSLASILITMLLLAVSISTSEALSREFLGLAGDPVPPAVVRLLAAWLLGTLIPDYISLLETRYVLARLSVQNRSGHLAGLIALDFVATTIIARLGVVIVSFWMFTGNAYLSDEYTTAIALQYARRFTLDILFRVDYFPGIGATYNEATGFYSISTGVWLYPSYLTSVWIWLQLFALLLVRLSPRMDKFLGRLRWLLDYKKQPFRALGGVAAFLVVLLFALAWPFV